MDGDDRTRVREWLSLIAGPGFRGRDARDAAVAEIRAAGVDRAIALLAPVLADPDPEDRCRACELLFRIDPRRGVDLILPLLQDPDVVVRWQAAGCLHDFGDERAIPALIETLERDPAPEVRGTAAYALGGIGSPAAIPALLRVLDSDYAADELGHTPSSAAAVALRDILAPPGARGGAVPRESDLPRLRTLAEERYRQWREQDV
jgi:HEAT repeat protein